MLDHSQDFLPFGPLQLHLQHILHPLVVDTVTFPLCSMAEFLILAPVLMETNHGVKQMSQLQLTRVTTSSTWSLIALILTHHVPVHLRCQHMWTINLAIAVSFINSVLILCFKIMFRLWNTQQRRWYKNNWWSTNWNRRISLAGQ